MIEQGIRGGIYHAIHRYEKANDKYMKNYYKNEESFLEYLDANSQYGWAMSQPLQLDGFDWVKKFSKIDEDFIYNYDEDSDKGYIFYVDIEYPRELYYLHSDLHSDLPLLPERMKVNKCNKLSCNLYDESTMFFIQDH